MFKMLLKVFIISIFFILVKKIYKKLLTKKIYTGAFILGSVSLFIIVIVFAGSKIENIITIMELYILKLLENYLYNYEVLIREASIIIESKCLMNSIKVNYECSGVIEILSFLSITIFYPVKKKWRKFISILRGTIMIFIGNLSRIIIIIASFYYFNKIGFNIMYLVVSKLFFYSVVLVVYYYELTRIHIKEMWEE